MTEFKDVDLIIVKIPSSIVYICMLAYLEKIGKVYHHVIPRFLLSACDIQTNSDDI